MRSGATTIRESLREPTSKMNPSEASTTRKDWEQPIGSAASEEGGDPRLTEKDGLFLDVDGTLIDFADRPDAVATPAGLVDTLSRIEMKLDGALALVIQSEKPSLLKSLS